MSDKKTIAEIKDAICSTSADFSGGLHFDVDNMLINTWEELADYCTKRAKYAYRLSCSLASYSAHARRRAKEKSNQQEVG